MPTHFSILAWKIPWTEEPGGLQSRITKSWTDWAAKPGCTQCICFNVTLSIRPSLSFPCCVHESVLCLSLYSRPANRFISTIFLGATYMASQVVLVVKNPSANAGDLRDTGLILVRIPWRRKWQLTRVSLLGRFHGQRSLTGRVQGRKELDRLSN